MRVPAAGGHYQRLEYGRGLHARSVCFEHVTIKAKRLKWRENRTRAPARPRSIGGSESVAILKTFTYSDFALSVTKIIITINV